MSSTTTTTPDVWEDGLELLFERIGDPLPVCWKERERPFVEDGIVLLKVIADLSIGVDEYRIVYDPAQVASDPPEEMIPTSCGSALVTLQVQVETFDQDASGRARTALRRIRQRLRWPSSLQALRKIETSLVDILTIPVIDRVQDGRVYSLATMDVRLNTIQVENDKPFGRIDTIVVQPDLLDESGVPLTLPPFTIDLPDT